MKWISFSLLAAISWECLAANAPYKIVIISDDGALKEAAAFKEYLMKKPPYSKMKPEDLNIKIVTSTEAEMKCLNSSDRVVSCDTSVLHKIKAKEEANLALAFTSKGSGGGGGYIPVATKDYPIATMLHEMLHAYGMDDEYCYSKVESARYCNIPSKPNMARFASAPPYADNQAARVKHTKDVPWMASINPLTLILNGTLGSKFDEIVPGKQVLGLYKGGDCDEVIESWRPYPKSIMKGFKDDTVYPLYENIILKGIEASLGRKLAIKIDECPEPPVAKGSLEDINKLKNFMEKK